MEIHASHHTPIPLTTSALETQTRRPVARPRARAEGPALQGPQAPQSPKVTAGRPEADRRAEGPESP